MPTFLQTLAANPAGSGSIYGMPQQQQQPDVLSLVNQLKDREMRDFKEKANFLSDLSLKQNRLSRIYDQSQENLARGPNVMDTQIGADQGAITPFQKAQLGVQQTGQALEGQRLAQQAKLGQEGLDIKTAQEKLNQQKSDQINAQKTADLQRKVDEGLAAVKDREAKIKQAGDNFDARLKAIQEHQKAMEDYHKADMERRQHEFDVTNENHKQTIADMQKKLDQQSRTKTTTKISGDEKTTTTERGSAADRVQIKGPDGVTYEVPADKAEHFKSTFGNGQSDQEDQSDQESSNGNGNGG